MAGYAEILPFPTKPISSTAQIVDHSFRLDDCCAARCLVHPKDELAHILTHVCGLSAVEDGEVMVRAYLMKASPQIPGSLGRDD